MVDQHHADLLNITLENLGFLWAVCGILVGLSLKSLIDSAFS